MDITKLKELKVDSKQAWVSYPADEDFQVLLCAVPRAQIRKLTKECTVSKFSRESRTVVEELDSDAFVDAFTDKAIKGWRGLTLGILQDLILIEVSPTEDLTQEVEYSPEMARMLVRESVEFDTWLNQAVFDLKNFR